MFPFLTYQLEGIVILRLVVFEERAEIQEGS
jgi:hypothetical protein